MNKLFLPNISSNFDLTGISVKNNNYQYRYVIIFILKQVLINKYYT